MLTFVSGNLFDSDAEALVNPVNCVGVSGAGLAKDFARRFPEIIPEYRRLCRIGHLRPGHARIVTRETQPHVILFPTKRHWKEPSLADYILGGLTTMDDLVEEEGVRSVALPALGCGLGGLAWRDVRWYIEDWYEYSAEHTVDWRVYVPPGATVETEAYSSLAE
jgi:O-acetyl-ADP-ribose deacetylase (regulator of RNase III)